MTDLQFRHPCERNGSSISSLRPVLVLQNPNPCALWVQGAPLHSQGAVAKGFRLQNHLICIVWGPLAPRRHIQAQRAEAPNVRNITVYNSINKCKWENVINVHKQNVPTFRPQCPWPTFYNKTWYWPIPTFQPNHPNHVSHLECHRSHVKAGFASFQLLSLLICWFPQHLNWISVKAYSVQVKKPLQ